MSLTAFIKTHPDIRKIFGKKELLIIEKHQSGVSLTQSESNRLSRDIKKKFEIIRKLAPLLETSELKKGAEVKEMIEETKSAISNDILNKKIKRIILYGSAAENKLTLSSDIDLAVDFTEINKDEAFSFRKRILGRSNERIDIQVYNELPEKIRKEIDSKGKILYERQNK